jgi:hypothetical protein
MKKPPFRPRAVPGRALTSAWRVSRKPCASQPEPADEDPRKGFGIALRALDEPFRQITSSTAPEPKKSSAAPQMGDWD